MAKAEKLSNKQLERLAEHGVTYPWTPWKSLELLAELEALEARNQELHLELTVVLAECSAMRVILGKPPNNAKQA